MADRIDGSKVYVDGVLAGELAGVEPPGRVVVDLNTMVGAEGVAAITTEAQAIEAFGPPRYVDGRADNVTAAALDLLRAPRAPLFRLGLGSPLKVA